MAKKLKALRTITVKNDMKDMKGWTIPANSTLHVMKEAPPHPTLKYKLLVVRVDNGTGILELMPETLIREQPVK